jgi:parvulin-like peptidyl-prolyl isomerase
VGAQTSTNVLLHGTGLSYKDSQEKDRGFVAGFYATHGKDWVHLIEVVERREVPVDPRVLREQARNILRGQKFESAYAEWVRELRSRAYVELRDAPL